MKALTKYLITELNTHTHTPKQNSNQVTINKHLILLSKVRKQNHSGGFVWQFSQSCRKWPPNRQCHPGFWCNLWIGELVKNICFAGVLKRCQWELGDDILQVQGFRVRADQPLFCSIVVSSSLFNLNPDHREGGNLAQLVDWVGELRDRSQESAWDWPTEWSTTLGHLKLLRLIFGKTLYNFHGEHSLTSSPVASKAKIPNGDKEEKANKAFITQIRH